jgi:shikimate 5-dehydrogenase
MSVTIPYKTAFREEPLIEKRGDLCAKHGITNTVFKDETRRLVAVNTDIFGIKQCYRTRTDLEHKNALIIGAGATAETFCAYFEALGFKASFINRSQWREEAKQRFSNIVDFLPLRPQPVHIKTSPVYSTLVNTLPSEVVYENWDAIELNLKNLF